MKKIIVVLITVILLMLLTACASDDAVNTETEASDTSKTTTVTQTDNQDDTVLTIEGLKQAAETDASLFDYEEVDGGVAITGFNGEDEVVVIPRMIDEQTVTAISNNAFINNQNIRGVCLSDSIAVIGANAFEYCLNLELFISGEGLKRIEEYAFNACSNLNVIHLNEGLESLSFLCFGGTNITEIKIPVSVTEIMLPFTANYEQPITIISSAGSKAEQYVNEYGEEYQLTFQAE